MAKEGGAQVNSGLAIASFVLGIVSLVFVWLFIIAIPAGIAAIILGILGLRQIKKENKKGKAFAIIGLVFGIISIVLFIIIILGAVFLRSSYTESAIKSSLG